MKKFQFPKFRGDAEFSVETTGDVVVGDAVRFERTIFAGGFTSMRFVGFELITGIVTADSYGKKLQQHTFTIETADGKKFRVRGSTLYKNGVWRKLWTDESARIVAADEKHDRGACARADRDLRVEVGA